MKTPDEITKIVDCALERQFDFFEMIDDCALTDEEKEWAKENIGYKAYRYDEDKKEKI